MTASDAYSPQRVGRPPTYPQNAQEAQQKHHLRKDAHLNLDSRTVKNPGEKHHRRQPARFFDFEQFALKKLKQQDSRTRSSSGNPNIKNHARGFNLDSHTVKKPDEKHHRRQPARLFSPNDFNQFDLDELNQNSPPQKTNNFRDSRPQKINTGLEVGNGRGYDGDVNDNRLSRFEEGIPRKSQSTSEEMYGHEDVPHEIQFLTYPNQEEKKENAMPSFDDYWNQYDINN